MRSTNYIVIHSFILPLLLLSFSVGLYAEDNVVHKSERIASNTSNRAKDDKALTWRITTSNDGRVTLYTLRVKNNTNRHLYVTGIIKVQSTKESVHFAKTIKAGQEVSIHDETGIFAVIKMEYQDALL